MLPIRAGTEGSLNRPGDNMDYPYDVGSYSRKVTIASAEAQQVVRPRP